MTNATAVELRPFDLASDYEPIADLVTSTNADDGVEEVMTVPSLRLAVAPDGHHHPERDVRVALVDGENERLRLQMGWLGQAVRRPWRRQGVGAGLIAEL